MFNLIKNLKSVGSIDFNAWKEKNKNLIEEKLIYAESSIEYFTPKTIEEISTVFNGRVEKIPSMFVRKIKNAKCYTKTGFVLTPDDIPINNYTPLGEHPLRNKRKYKFKNSIYYDGNIALFTNDSCQKNYYHWLIEAFSRIHLIEKSGFSVDKYILCDEIPYQKRILELFEIPEEKIIKIEPNTLVQAEFLIIPDIINYFNLIETSDRIYYNAKFIPKWVFDFYRTKFLPLVKKTEPKKIYISRKNAPYRKIQNELEVIEFLKQHGFNVYYPEEMDFLEQVELFYNAETVVSTHGAGLTNIMFCDEKANIIEIFDPGYLYQGQQMIAQSLGLNYIYFYSKPLQDKYPGFRLSEIELNKLKKCLI